MDSTDNELLGYDALSFDDPSEPPTHGLPTDAEALYALVRDLTADILELEWEAAVYSQFASGRLHRTYLHRTQAVKAMAPPAATDALEAGRRQFAEGFTNDEARGIFLSGNDLERTILETESKLLFLKWVAENAPNGNPPLIRPARVYFPAR